MRKLILGLFIVAITISGVSGCRHASSGSAGCSSCGK
jgi:hypothetical protein